MFKIIIPFSIPILTTQTRAQTPQFEYSILPYPFSSIPIIENLHPEIAYIMLKEGISCI